MQVPLLLLAGVFAALAWGDWKRVPILARVLLGAAAVFALAGLAHPGWSVSDILDGPHDGLAWMVEATRFIALPAALASILLKVLHAGGALR